MPWEQTNAVAERIKFIADYLEGQYCKSQLCRMYGISRPTAYKWIERYEHGKAKGFENLSRAPHHHPNQTSDEIREMIVQAKFYCASWGPKKIMDYLRANGPELKWPADSTAGAILKRLGLVKRRVKRRHVSPYRGEQRAVWRLPGPQSDLECRLQRGLCSGERPSLLPADAVGQLLAISAVVSGFGTPELRCGSALV
jgi:transposase